MSGQPPKSLLELSRREWEYWRQHGCPVREPLSGGRIRCPLVNPLCPDDLCVLPAGHPGTASGWHVLGTDPYDTPHRYVRGKRSVFFMHPLGPGVRDNELIHAGWEAQREIEETLRK